MMQKMKRFARFWDMVYNSGNFKQSVVFLFSDGKVYEGFFAFSQWIYQQTESTWQISLDRLAYLLYRYLDEVLHVNKELVKETLINDIMRVEGRKLPKFLRYENVQKESQNSKIMFNKRQLKHCAQENDAIQPD
jgi:hypothetical protein